MSKTVQGVLVNSQGVGFWSWSGPKGATNCGSEYLLVGVLVAAGPGFEPGLSDSESLVLPLHHPARKAMERILPFVGSSVEFPDICSRPKASTDPRAA